MSEDCEHEYEAFQNSRGGVVTSTTYWCTKCKKEKPRKLSDHEQHWDDWGKWVTRNGDYR